MYVCLLFCICNSTYGGQNGASDLLKLDLEAVVDCLKSTWILCKSSKCSYLHSHVLSPCTCFS